MRQQLESEQVARLRAEKEAALLRVDRRTAQELADQYRERAEGLETRLNEAMENATYLESKLTEYKLESYTQETTLERVLDQVRAASSSCPRAARDLTLR